MQKAKIIAATLLGILALIVVVQNTDAIETRLLFATVTMPRAVLLFGTLLVGFAGGVLVASRLVRVGNKKLAPPPKSP